MAPAVDAIYEDYASIPEETLYEPMPAIEGWQLGVQPAALAPKPGQGKQAKRKEKEEVDNPSLFLRILKLIASHFYPIHTCTHHYIILIRVL